MPFPVLQRLSFFAQIVVQIICTYHLLLRMIENPLRDVPLDTETSEASSTSSSQIVQGEG